MSGTTLRMLISLGAFFAIFWATQHVAKLETERLTNEKELALHDQPKTHYADKVRGPLSSEIKLVSAAAGPNEQVMVLQATVSSATDAKNVNVRWVLPANMTLVTGSLETMVPEISPEQPFHAQITVQQKGLENKQIHLVASSEQPGLRFSSVSQYNTMDQEFLQQQKEMVIKSLGDKPKSKRANIIH